MGSHGGFLRQYDRMITWRESEIDQVHGRRLGPSLVTFHVQFVWRNWLVMELDAGEIGWVKAPDFSQGLNMLDIHNNIMWLPTVINIPTLLDFRATPRAPALVQDSDHQAHRAQCW
jgi:hypothetical protein